MRSHNEILGERLIRKGISVSKSPKRKRNEEQEEEFQARHAQVEAVKKKLDDIHIYVPPQSSPALSSSAPKTTHIK